MIDITFVTDCLCLCIRARKNIIIIIIMNIILFELHSSYPEQIIDFFAPHAGVYGSNYAINRRYFQQNTSFDNGNLTWYETR